MNMTAFVDEFVKIAALGQVGGFLAGGGWKYPAIAGGSIAAFLAARQAKDDWKLGRQMRKRYEQQGG
jgi:uncharacterized membrane protein YdjX (TVP38/TMEM64 family)